MTTLPSQFDPFTPMRAFAAGDIDFPLFFTSIPAVNAFLETNRLKFPRLRPTPFDGLDAAFRQELQALAARLAAAAEDARRRRLVDFYFLFWLSLQAINIDREPETEWWQEWMNAACCTVYLNCVSACVRLLAGQFVDDREPFLARLRPCFQQALVRLSAKSTTCGCSEDLTP